MTPTPQCKSDDDELGRLLSVIHPMLRLHHPDLAAAQEIRIREHYRYTSVMKLLLKAQIGLFTVEEYQYISAAIRQQPSVTGVSRLESIAGRVRVR